MIWRHDGFPKRLCRYKGEPIRGDYCKEMHLSCQDDRHREWLLQSMMQQYRNHSTKIYIDQFEGKMPLPKITISEYNT